MKSGIENHPSYLFGRHLKDKRIALRITGREMSRMIDMDVCQYSETEHGIIKWLMPHHLAILTEKLQLKGKELHTFYLKLTQAQLTLLPPLTCLGDVFELTDVLPRWSLKKKDGSRMTKEEMIEMGKGILAPLD